jgi:uncharacterized protein HemY
LSAAFPAIASGAQPAPAPASRGSKSAPGGGAPNRSGQATNTRPLAPSQASPIRIASSKIELNPEVSRAYQAFLAGDLAAARAGYEQVLKTKPRDTDALRGLAAIGIRQGRFDAAEDHYLRLLEADPQDAAAQAGLIGLRAPADPARSESRLKTLLAGQPDSPVLHFTLGNLYAGQRRWNEAQQAYFRAYTEDSDNPDYLFNLAVSLEQVRQPKLALQSYRGALAAAAHRPAAFDENLAAARVRELQR